jgi:hypothetical protein
MSRAHSRHHDGNGKRGRNTHVRLEADLALAPLGTEACYVGQTEDSDMAGAWRAVSIPGSFQNGSRTFAEDPLREIWRRIARLGTIEEARRICGQIRVPRDRPAVVSARIRQGVELRQAAVQASLLTAPLLQYYALQNLVRAFIGFGRKEEPASSHGMDFHPKGKNLLDAEATFGASGTFPTLVKVFGGNSLPGQRLTLRQALSSIPELRESEQILGPSRVGVVMVTAFFNREAPMQWHISLPGVSPSDLRVTVATVFPHLAAILVPAESESAFVVTADYGEETANIGDFLASYLMPDLRVRDDARWYCLRRDDHVPPLPRIAYYFAASFLLSNLVRYEPVVLGGINPDASELGWLLREFLQKADRYVPQLLLSIGRKHPVYFG